MHKQFDTFQPGLVTQNSIVTPRCFNGMCLIRQYRVTVEEIEEPPAVLESRLRKLWSEKGNRHSSNICAMKRESRVLGITLGSQT